MSGEAHSGTGGRSTPFSDAFRSAVDHRGLPLSRLRDLLSERGFRVSVATLSYWQSGRSQPERAASLQALDALEEILEADHGHLRRLLDAPRPRGRQQPATAMDPAEIVVGWAELERQGHHNLAMVRRLSVHLFMTLSRERTAVIEARALFRVHAEEVDRISVYLSQHGPADRPPEIVPRRGCTLGAVHVAPDADAVIVELMLPEPLPRGATFTLEYDLLTHQAETRSHTLIEIYRTGQSVLGATFDPQALPHEVRVVEVLGSGEATVVPVALRSDHSVLLSRQDFGPGRLGLEWDWEPDPTP